MKIVTARASFKKTTLFATALVLAVSGGFAAVPFIFSHQVNAISSVSADNISNYTDLKAALVDSTVGTINLAPEVNINTPEKLVLSRSDVRIFGNDSTLTYTGPNAGVVGWNGMYVLQVYGATNVEITSLRVAGGDAGMLINGSEVTLRGNTHVLNNEFGGIEVSKGSAANVSKLTLLGNLWDPSSAEAPGKPAVWVVNGQGSVDQTNLNVPLTIDTGVNATQTHYYLKATNANAVATNNKSTAPKNFTSIQAAIDDAGTVDGDTIVINRNVELNTKSVRITKSLTIEGNNKTIKTTFDRGEGGVSNAAFIVLQPDTTIKNITIQGKSGASAAHGVVVNLVKEATLENITLKDNAAGVIINGSEVVIDGIHTENNNWYAVNVDGLNAKLDIRGTNTHTEANQIYAENKANVIITDTNSQYAKVYKRTLETDVMYILKSATPTASLTINGASGSVKANDRDSNNPIMVTGTAIAGAYAVTKQWFEIEAPNGDLYYKYDYNHPANVYSFKLRDVANIPLDNKGRLLAGEYQIRYVATDSNEVRSDAYVTSVASLTVDNTPTTTTPVVGGAGDNPTSEPASSVTTDNGNLIATANNNGFPLSINPATADILGTTTDPASNANSDEAVEGASTESKLAAAVGSESNKGTYLGFGWYWWIVIVAVVAAIIGWIIAAARKRQSEF